MEKDLQKALENILSFNKYAKDQFEKINSRFDNIDNNLAEINENLENIESDVLENRRLIGESFQKITVVFEHEERLKRVEAHL